MSSYLRALRLVNFRNYADATALLSPGLNIVVGDNAQGKTNLLEAISFTVTGSSPRTANDSEVVRWQEDFARTEMRVVLDDGEERKVAVGYAPGQKKRPTVDGAPATSLANYAAGGAGVRAVTFFPDDIRIVKGAPSDRREFLDTLLSTLRPSYARAASEYTKAPPGVAVAAGVLGSEGRGPRDRDTARPRKGDGTAGRTLRGGGADAIRPREGRVGVFL